MATDLLDIRAAAELTGRHPETVRRWVWSGKLRAERRGRRLMVHRAELEALSAPQKPKMTLAEWAEMAREFQASTSCSGRSKTAADLVLADRAERSGLPFAGL